MLSDILNYFIGNLVVMYNKFSLFTQDINCLNHLSVFDEKKLVYQQIKLIHQTHRQCYLFLMSHSFGFIALYSLFYPRSNTTINLTWKINLCVLQNRSEPLVACHPIAPIILRLSEQNRTIFHSWWRS